jgi:hypothetical protein
MLYDEEVNRVGLNLRGFYSCGLVGADAVASDLDPALARD